MAFKDIIGQEKAIELLKSYFREKKPHHSYLFLGPKGVGKTTCALNFAKLLNCEKPSFDGEPCDACKSCLAIERGYHPDVQLVGLTPQTREEEESKGKKDQQKEESNGKEDKDKREKEKRELGIDEIREVRKSAYTSCVWGKWKVYIVERAEVLTKEAGDALLKILEEPPERCLFILLAPTVGDVAPTIASRCHIINFPPVRKELIAEFLVKRYNLRENVAYSLASLAEGRPGYAINLTRNEKIRKAREEVIDFLLEMPLNPDYALRAAQKILQIANQMEEKNKNREESISQEEAEQEEKMDEKSRIQQCLLFASSLFRDLFFLRLSGDENLLVNYDRKERLRSIYKNYDLTFLHSALNALQRTYRLLQPGYNVNPRLALEVMFIDILGGR